MFPHVGSGDPFSERVEVVVVVEDFHPSRKRLRCEDVGSWLISSMNMLGD